MEAYLNAILSLKMKTLRPYQQDAVNTIKSRLKLVTHPLLLTASVGAGKSLIIAEILKWIEGSNFKALCLTLNSTLIQQNAKTYIDQDGQCGIYCSGLDKKDTSHNIIFGSPQSIAIDIKKNKPIAKIKFNLIIVDEAHQINPHNPNTLFQRIINHYGYMAQSERYSYRILGLTGTPYRENGASIVGPDQFFKEELCNISTAWLISQGFLTKPEFGLNNADSYDFSRIRAKSTGKFSGSELQAVIDSNKRLTSDIMNDLQVVMQSRIGAFIFASTRRHCVECSESLPSGEWAIVTGETPHAERKTILERARNGNLKYLISVSCLNVGVDVPSYDVCAWLRPTESLILYTQGIGRVLRLHPDKKNALVLDYAGNLDRHGDIDDPIINDALKPKPENEKDYCIPCHLCRTQNTIHARRCIGIHDNKRCTHYFEWKDCSCGIKNDKTSRQCRDCGKELIDPNKKLSIKTSELALKSFQVSNAKYWVLNSQGTPRFHAMYQCVNGLRIYESYHIRDSRMANIFYGIFMKQHVPNASFYYPNIQTMECIKSLIESGDILTPHTIECTFTNRFIIKKRHFYHEETIAIDCDAAV